MATADTLPQPAISVVICTHQPRREYLQRTLAALRAQTLPPAQWEFLLVDNASNPAVAEGYELAWHPLGRHLVEPKLGLTAARVRGITEARGHWLVFVDDDNVLADDYLTCVAQQAKDSQLGVFGAGDIKPEFEVAPARAVESLLPLLALRDVKAARRGRNPSQTDALPCGAGLCVRRDVAARFAERVRQLQARVVLGRKGGELFSHEDDLFSWAAADLGLEFGLLPELRLTHLIPAGRLRPEYLLRLIFYHTFSHWILRYSLAGETPRRTDWRRRLRLAPHALKNGLFSARCQGQWLRGEDHAARFIVENHLVPLVKSDEKAQNYS